MAPLRASATPQEAAARVFVDELAHGAWEHPKTKFSPKLVTLLPPSMLKQSWAGIEEAAGRYFECKEAKLVAQGEFTTVNLECVFEHTEKTIRITFDGSGALSGLWYVASEEFLERRVRALVDKMNEGDFVAASRDFGPVMREKLSPDKLAAAWRELLAAVGRLQSIEKVSFDRSESMALARFERAKIQVRVSWDAGDKVIGLFFAPHQPWTPPAYGTANAVEATDITVGTSPKLPGILMLPAGAAKVPAVVLIHGSGPGDRDEAIGGVRVFADLAWGLANLGIAVLRYDKRSRVLPAGILTEKEEVLDAAEEAIALLRQHPRVDAKRIFVIGHSQGGNLAPRIAAKATDLAGYVSLAGSTRPIQDVVIDQYEYFAKLRPNDAVLEEKVREAREFKTRVEDPALKATDDPKPPFGGGTTGAYFLFQRGYDPVATAKQLAIPVLVLQGGRDYQVTSKDYERWTSGLEGQKFASFRWYPELNHLFVRGDGPPRPEEYNAPGHVDERVIRDLAEWMATH